MNGKLTRGIEIKKVHGSAGSNAHRVERNRMLVVAMFTLLVLSALIAFTVQSQQKNIMAWDEKVVGNPGKNVQSESGEMKGIAHAPIHINGNADFANQAQQEGWAGDGTQGNPYIIEGYDINGNGGTYCIWIENTDVWFVIRNCKVWNATGTASEPYGTGIYLKNVQHGKLENNDCSGNSADGIYLYSSSNNSILNNTCSSNSDDGIDLYSYGSPSSNNAIQNNTCTGNSGMGIYIHGSTATPSSNILISNNTCSGNRYDGISLFYSSNNVITNNTCSYNYEFGICLFEACNNNIITNNTFYHNIQHGIAISYYITPPAGNTIHHNYFYQNNGAGRGVNGNCQAYDNAGGNTWYDDAAKEGNYWSNWDGNSWGTPSAYPIAGGAGAYDMYPLGSPTPELSPLAVLVVAIVMLGTAVILGRRSNAHGK
jgi:parallel beta-helix repeat protein